MYSLCNCSGMPYQERTKKDERHKVEIGEVGATALLLVGGRRWYKRRVGFTLLPSQT